MNRLVLRLVLIPIWVFLALIGMIRARPYDDGGLRDFLSPSQDCSSPCFMGIRPGVTSVEQAVTLLNTHTWVRNLRLYYDRIGRINRAQWSWSGLQPDLIDGSTPGYILVQDGFVVTISAATIVPLGNLWLLLGIPDKGLKNTSEGDSPIVYYDAGYLSRSLGVQSIIRCPVYLKNLLETRVTISFMFDLESRFGSSDYHLSDWISFGHCA